MGAFAVLGMVITAPNMAMAADSQGGGEAVVINPGGGQLPDGSDGMSAVFNGAEGLGYNSDLTVPNTGSDQIFVAGTTQWCCGGGGMVLAIGSTAYGEAGAATNSSLSSFTSIEVVSVSGAAVKITNGNASDTALASYTQKGNATATLRYTVNHGGRDYIVLREISYTFPNKYYSESWSVTIPSGNTDIVKLYYGGDAAPGGEDSAYGKFYDVNGRRFFLSLEPNSGIYLGFVESPGSEFDHYFVGQYDTPYDAIAAGQDLSDTVDETPDTDIGVQIQWTFGTTPGTYKKTATGVSGFVADVESDVNNLPATGMSATSIYAAFVLCTLGFGVVALGRRTRRA